MKLEFKKYRYYLLIIFLYFLTCLHFFIFIDSPLSYYTYNQGDMYIFLILILCSIPTLFIVNHLIKFKKLCFSFNFKNILPILFYALILISLPEEIIFREIIQGFLENIFTGMFLPILISSLIFGFAHLLNGSRGIKPPLWNWKLAIMTFTCGIFLGVSYTLTNSLILPTLLHTVFLLTSKFFIKEEIKH